MNRTLTWDTLEPATTPTFYFVGVTTGSSSIRSVFPLWADHLGLADKEGAPVELTGIDLPVHADPAHYRAVVEFIAADPLSRGALVTTHKLDLFAACRDLFDEVDPLAELMHEVSSLSKREGRFRAHAKDPISSGLAVDAFAPSGYFAEQPADVIIFGAGGSAIAIDWHLSRPERGADRPRRVVVTNRTPDRLETLRGVHDASNTDAVLVTVPAPALADNDEVLNYRGDLVFLDQARAQEMTRNVQIEDGWVYFIHGWTQVIAEVFDVDIPVSGPAFDALSDLAAQTKEAGRS